jgi:hypothetical protein
LHLDLPNNTIYDEGKQQTFMVAICIVKNPSYESNLADFDFTPGENG